MTPSVSRLFGGARRRGELLTMISLYDAPSAALCCDAGVDVLLVGDSLGNVILGYESTVSVTMEDMLHHTAAVARGAKGSTRPEVPVVADLPFGSYASVELATANGVKLVRAGAHAVKLEGAGPGALSAIRALVEVGVPVMGHLGYTPQSSLRFESVVQGKTVAAAERLLEEARSLEEAGCFAVVLEVVPAEVARRVTGEISIPTIGIGAGAGCNGQVLVWHDLAGLTPGAPLRFVRRYAEVHALLTEAARGYIGEVRSGAFPQPEHGWSMDETELRGWSAAGGEGGERS
jgi:3-methyl-2-oxobutanoate hydroxymethyltransferase